ncbi:MAG TPA: hypothetical protein VED20_05270 [Streptosporangiaceae bacterium]|nr:hypothetical protein [Streptosporangiaceae bacterium]
MPVPPAGSTSMPWFVPSTTVPAAVAASEVAVPAAGATAALGAGPALIGSIGRQLAPPSAEEKISFFCPPPGTGGGMQVGPSLGIRPGRAPVTPGPPLHAKAAPALRS